MRILFAFALAMCASVSLAADQAIVQHLQNVSVTIKAGNAEGSGFIKTRSVKVGEKDEAVSYVWTAAHVVAGLRKTRTVIDAKSGTPRTLVEFDDASIVQELNESGRRVGEVKMDAQVVRYSNADTGEDLALLLIRKRNFVAPTVSVQFYADAMPPVGTELYHVGSLLGQMGACSLTTGIVSQYGRVLPNGKTFDQSSAVAFPGSSGGLLSIKSDGRVAGMLVRGAGEGFNLFVPVRRMRDWAKRVGCEFALDDAVAVPTDAELFGTAIEDGEANAKAGGKSVDAKFLIRVAE